MQTKLIAALIILVLIGGGTYYFQKDRQKKDLKVHHIEQIKQLSKAAQKSSAAGLMYMASAINRYHKEKGKYPASLLRLYPDFIPVESFITKLKWHYRPTNVSFLLQKSAPSSNIFASMGPNLQLKTSEKLITASGTMIASSGTTPPSKTINNKKGKATPGKQKKANKIKSDNKNTMEDNKLAQLSPPQNTLTPAINTPASKKHIDIEKKTETNIIRKSLSRHEQFLSAFDNTNFYIWKTKNGVIGFSNMQYPDEKGLAFYMDHSWIEYVN